MCRIPEEHDDHWTRRPWRIFPRARPRPARDARLGARVRRGRDQACGGEWDEREETPWPILEEAAKIGLYSLDFFSGQWLEPTGLGIPIAFEELFWGDAGIALSLVGSTLAAVAVASNGTPEQIGEWLPEMFGDPG